MNLADLRAQDQEVVLAPTDIAGRFDRQDPAWGELESHVAAAGSGRDCARIHP